MSMLTRRKMVLAKVETTKGTDASPTAGSNLILPNGDLQIQVPIEQDTGAGDLKSTFGPGQSVTFKQAMKLATTVRVRGLGSGASALTEPMIAPLLRASGHDVATAGDGSSTAKSATYTPTSVGANLKSNTVYFYEDGLLYKMLGAVCNLSFEAAMNALIVKAEFQSKYTAPATASFPSFTAPTEEVFRMTNTLCTMSDGSTINIGKFTFDSGAKVSEAYETGNHEFQVEDREPTITIDPLAIASAADWTALINATSFHLTATFTNSLGETLVFDAPAAVLQEISTGDRAGRITREKKFSLKETSGDDQYSIEWTSVL
ncbi:MAG: hypothetical protein GC151_13930 [Betaproteobacteria bacterium]|nr:hypothetical protein [Betaproteobacteria bacterium]